MKKAALTLLTLFLSTIYCFSQDTITKKSGDDIQAKVLEVTSTEIKYKKFDNLTGPTFTILKADVFRIVYENGTKDVFNEKETSPRPARLRDDPYVQGEVDAVHYYKGYKPAATGTLVVSLISPLAGLVPAVVTSTAYPKESSLNYPNAELMENEAYNKGYTQKAKKIKQGKVWKNWGIAFGVNVLLVLALVSGQ